MGRTDNTLNKGMLVTHISERMEIPRGQTAELLDAFLNTITEALTDGMTINITGFGKFTPKVYEAHTARNPSTGEDVEVPERTRIGFKAGVSLKNTVNEGKED